MADPEKNLYNDIAQLLEQARKHVQRTTNSAMACTYHEIGRRIVEEEQRGCARQNTMIKS